MSAFVDANIFNNVVHYSKTLTSILRRCETLASRKSESPRTTVHREWLCYICELSASWMSWCMKPVVKVVRINLMVLW